MYFYDETLTYDVPFSSNEDSCITVSSDYIIFDNTFDDNNYIRNFFGLLSPSPNFLSLNVMKLSPLFPFLFPVLDLTTLPQKNSNLWSPSTIVPDVFPSPDYIPLFA